MSVLIVICHICIIHSQLIRSDFRQKNGSFLFCRTNTILKYFEDLIHCVRNYTKLACDYSKYFSKTAWLDKKCIKFKASYHSLGF